MQTDGVAAARDNRDSIAAASLQGSRTEATETQAAAEQLRDSGNNFFKAQDYPEAARCYREALTSLQRLQGSGKEASLEQLVLIRAVRLNLASTLLNLGEDFDEAIGLCNAVLSADPGDAKALFKRGSLRHAAAELLGEGSQKREALTTARRDLLEAARAEPQDARIRAVLEEITQVLRKLPSSGWGQRGLGGGLYDDRGPAPEPPPPVICSVCGRTGHPCCGREFWVSQRAKWLGMPADVVGEEPPGFEDEGPLAEAVREVRVGHRPSQEDRLSDLSEDERELLEDCLDATERPFPELRRKLPLVQAVRCAVELWEEDC